MIRVQNLSKAYGGVQALRDVSIALAHGEVHGLCGENGAGKSTLIKCLTGVTVPDSGAVTCDGLPLRFGKVRAAEQAGVAVIHQESTVFPDLNTVDNIFVARERTRWGGCWLDRAGMVRESKRLLERLGQRFDVLQPARMLSVGQRKMVSIARALSQDCRWFIMDEPTAALSERETELLKWIVRRLRQERRAVLYVSHRLEEVLDLADQITVLRDGALIATQDRKQLDRKKLIQLMIGREVLQLTRTPQRPRPTAVPALEVLDLSAGKRFQNVQFEIAPGEIVGLAGLVGAGRTELAQSIFGLRPITGGEVRVAGVPLARLSPGRAIQQGLVMVPEDRQHEGLVLPMTITENLTMTVLDRIRRHGLIDHELEQQIVHASIQRFGIRAESPQVRVDALSGGNQQKVVLAKWLAREPQVLLLDEPTCGIDVAAKAQIHAWVDALAKRGMATLFISSEIAELMAVCDRVLVMRQGRLQGEFDPQVATQQQILDAALPHEVRDG